MRLVPGCAAFAALSVAFAVHEVPRLAAKVPDPARLELGRVVERRLGRGEAHRYAIPLKAGGYAAVTVTQHEIDVIVRLRGPDDRPIADFDDQVLRGGQERVAVVADADATYTLVIEPAAGSGAAGSYAIRMDVRRRATDADRAMHAARKLRTAAAQLEAEGRFDGARAALEQALAGTERIRGPDDLQVAAVAAQLAGVYRRLPDGPKSESLYKRAITIFERTLGSDHPTTAHAQAQLASLYEHEGDRRRAETLLRHSLDVINKTLGSDHPWFVGGLTTLGNLLDSAGDLDEEEAIVQRALAILEKAGDTNSVQYAGLLNNLGEVYRQKREYARAEALLQRSLVLGERLLGPTSYTIATALQNLGIVARERKDYASAIAYNLRALSIRERMVGPDHPDVAHILTNLANIYRATGDYGSSLETHFRALHIWETAAGPYQQATLLSVGNIAKTYAAGGDVENAIAYQRRSDAILEKELALNLAIGSERQKLTFAASVAERTDRTISLHLNIAPHDSEAGELATLVILQRKGRVLDAMTDAFAAVRQRVPDSRDGDLLDQLKTTTAELARLALKAPEAISLDQRQSAIKELEAKKERLEAELSDHSAEFRAHMQPVTVDAVQAAIPDDAVLLEFAIYRPFDPKAERNAEAYGPPRYAAYLVRKHGEPRGLDLGPASSLDAAVEALREALRDPRRSDVKARARAVDERVLQPLRSSLGGARRLLISPDGELNLVPFEALVDDQDRYLIERYAVSYLTSGRDLLRMRVARVSRGAPIIFADPLFGEPQSGLDGVRGESTLQAPRLSVTTANDLSTVYFAPLAATAEEARAIKTLFPEAALHTGRLATKAALQRVEAPRILHIASHGFFLQDAASDRAEVRAAPAAGAREMTARRGLDNPLLRSGLALAGANVAHDSPGEGILTALEASSLNLWGTRLVTLSGCDTGVGEVRNGEGVYGLRRAFVLAGTETLVMSLWPVTDGIARETMVAYYTGLRAGLGRGDALRQAKLDMLKRRVRQHPYHWASFIQSGEWANLDGTR